MVLFFFCPGGGVGGGAGGGAGRVIGPSYLYDQKPKPSYPYDRAIIPLWSSHHHRNVCFTFINAQT